MSTVVVKRPARRPGPELPSGDIVLNAPPELPQITGRGWTQLLMMLPMLAGSGAMAFMFVGRSGSTLQWIMGGLFGLSSVGMLATSLAVQGGQPKKAELMAQRRDYMRYLAQMRKKVRRSIAAQRAAMHHRHPDPAALWSTAASHRLWERRPGDADYLTVRMGLGPQELLTPLRAEQTKAVEDLEPMTAVALRRFISTYQVIPDLPVALSLRSFSKVYVGGERIASLDWVRAMIAQLSTLQAPEDVRFAVCAANNRRQEWEHMKWLPHALHPSRADALGAVRLIAPSATGVESLLGDVLANRPRFGQGTATGPHLVVIVDGGDLAGSQHLMTDGGVAGVTIVDLSSRPPRTPDRTTIVFDVTAEKLVSTTQADSSWIGQPDALGLAEHEALCRQLSPLRLAAATSGQKSALGLAELMELGDPYAFDPVPGWAVRGERDRLRVPIGEGPDGEPIELDLKEPAQDGMGPHGLLIGATGSGKSELLRTLVLGLAAGHSPETLNFVLVDFKGGATFASMDKLPHTSAVITNLADELHLVDRMTEALQGELVRRQELLRAAGNFASAREYEKARAGGAPLAPLPSLLIVCDEFSELLTARPTFIDVFVQIGRVGRSLGVHLLLASQRLEEGKLRGLDTHLSYRIGLRTFSAVESRIVLGVPDAFELPRSPGHGYLRNGTEPLTQFKAAYVSGAHRRDAGLGAVRAASQVLDYGSRYVAPVAAPEQEETGSESLLDVLVSRMEGRGTLAHQVWLPPLEDPPTLDQLLAPLVTERERGLTVTNPELRDSLHVPAGIIDKPGEQRRDLLRADLTGHVAIVGGPLSGKSTMVRALIAATALTSTPARAQFYCLDLGGGSLASVRGLPHVGGVAGRRDAEPVRRTVAEVLGMVQERERLFADRGLDLTAFRAEGGADVFLVVDGWGALRSEYEELEATVTAIAARGLSYGVHVIATAARWADFRPASRDLFGARYELRLGEPGDSLVDRRAAAAVPAKAPGRGILPGGLHFLAALPRIDGKQGTEDLAQGCAQLVELARSAWHGQHAPAVRLLPDSVPPITGRADGLRIPLGVGESDLQPVYTDFAAEPHFLLFGDSGSGKSTFLRAMAEAITSRYSPQEARIILVDYRRSLLGAVEAEHLIGYGTNAASTLHLIQSVAAGMKDRLPPHDLTPEQHRDRSWWAGPECFVLVDDYDLVTAGPNPLAPLLDYLPQARDTGLHLILARSTGGAGRGLYEPVVQRLRELSSPGVVLSGNREEGALLGTVRPGPQPPGRGWLVTRKDGSQLVQLTHAHPAGP
ncbi:type VII secretion protein EccC [Longispora albida]|uniref:type VII secretion protein EccC n=1 Tax=Longispora albida TaxID=203523 RepID=UPI00047598DC|nr:type VII secretion protein EccC [Longispora albida]